MLKELVDGWNIGRRLGSGDDGVGICGVFSEREERQFVYGGGERASNQSNIKSGTESTTQAYHSTFSFISVPQIRSNLFPESRFMPPSFLNVEDLDFHRFL